MSKEKEEVYIGIKIDKNVNDKLNDYCDKRGLKKQKFIAIVIQDFLESQENGK